MSTTGVGLQSHSNTASLSSIASEKRCMATVCSTTQMQIDIMGFCNGNRTGGLGASINGSFRLGAVNTGGGHSQRGNLVVHEVVIISSAAEWGQIIRCARSFATSGASPIPTLCRQRQAAESSIKTQ